MTAPTALFLQGLVLLVGIAGIILLAKNLVQTVGAESVARRAETEALTAAAVAMRLIEAKIIAFEDRLGFIEMRLAVRNGPHDRRRAEQPQPPSAGAEPPPR